MPAVREISPLASFNVTEDAALFSHPGIGALYLHPDKDFFEIEQSKLKKAVTNNSLDPITGYDERYLEFYPDDLFIEKSFSSYQEAEKFISGFFDEIKISATQHIANIIKRLKLFTNMFDFSSKLNCRFEILSGDSCKKFHVDSVAARMIYTCAGPGTQIRHPERESVFSLPSGSCLIVKGLKYPEFRKVTLHRSPPIENKNIKRLLFIVDCEN